MNVVQNNAVPFLQIPIRSASSKAAENLEQLALGSISRNGALSNKQTNKQRNKLRGP
jgi:hypothetical protein